MILRSSNSPLTPYVFYTQLYSRAIQCKPLFQLITTIRNHLASTLCLQFNLIFLNAVQVFKATDLWLIIKYSRGQVDRVTPYPPVSSLTLSILAKELTPQLTRLQSRQGLLIMPSFQMDNLKEENKTRQLSYRPANELAG